MEEKAYAKINLALHVRARESDGYHSIETIFAFCEDGDLLALAPGGEGETLTVGGPFAKALGNGDDNLVLAAAQCLRWFEGFGGSRRRFPGAALHLEKRLPVAAGLGGGSADAAAAIRLLDRYWQACGDQKELCIRGGSLGADVPACIVSRTRIGTNRGDRLAMPLRDDVAGMAVLLVNPGFPLSTGGVFRAWDGVDRGPLLAAGALEAALVGRNDLEAPALSLCPQIADVLAALRGTGPLLARMSGSGATCFGLYRGEAERDEAAARVAAAQPDWWTLATRLR